MDGGLSFGALDAQTVAGMRGAREVRTALDAQRAADAGHSEEAATKFEQLLATQLVKEMRKGLSDGFFGSGAGADVFEGWLDEHLGSALARGGSLGLAQSIRISLDQKVAQPGQGKLL